MDPLSFALPHRPPFLFLDEVLEVVPGVLARARKQFMPEEAFFAGHFPGNPLVPGVILTEALAQVSGLIVGRPGLLLAAIRAMKFPAAVGPGEVIVLEAERQGGVGGLHQFSVRASVEGKTVAEGGIVLGESSQEK